MERLTMSLDDLIAQKEKKAFSGSNKRKNNDAGAVRGPSKKNAIRSAPYENRPRRTEAPARQMSFHAPQAVSNERNQNLSVFARIGKPIVSGTNVTFANLKPSVVEKDIQDLSSAIGEIKEVQIVAGRSARNTATVLFARRSDALACVSKLNGMTLDGSPMEVTVTGEPAEFHAPKSVFDRLEPAQQQQQNVRAGLFGTAINSDEDNSNCGPSFAVTLGGAAESFGRQAKLVQPFHTTSHNSNNNGSNTIVQPFASKKVHQSAGSSQFQGRGRGAQEGPNFLFRDEDDDHQQATRGLRQPFTQQRQKDRPQQRNNREDRSNDNGRPRSAGNQQRGQQQDRRPNSSSGGNGRGKGNNQQSRDAKASAASATDLDADLDAYFSK